MKDATHTPGPWEIWGNLGEMDLAVGPVAGGVAVAQIVTVNGIGIMDEETAQLGTANARLIAAAPALLAALEKIEANAADSPEWIRRVTGEALQMARGAK